MKRARPRPRSLEQYLAAAKAALARKQDVLSMLFDRQLDAVHDKSPRVLIRTTRRAGKTTSVLAKFIAKAMQNAHTHYAFIALTRPSAEIIAWPILKEIDRRFQLGIDFTEAKLRARLPNGSTIQLYGADRKGWSSRLLGTKLAGAAIDEAAFFQIDLRELVDEVLDPALSDLGGQLIMTSTPGPWLGGMFYDADTGKLPGWSCHRWSALDNPHMTRAFRTRMDQLKATTPDIESTPSYRRMYLGEWVLDVSDLVYLFDQKKNAIERYEKPSAGHDGYVLGVDLGWHDHTAFVVLAWSKDAKRVTVVETYRKREMLLDEVAATVRVYQQSYPGIAIVGDPARKQAFEELRARHGIPILKAFKSSKLDWIDVINSDLANGSLRIVEKDNAGLIEEMSKLTWLVRPNGSRVEQPGAANDACDAMLYAYRLSYHYRSEPRAAEPKKGSREYWKREADQMEAEEIERIGEVA